MAILIYITDRKTDSLKQLLQELLPNTNIYDYTDDYAPAEIEIILAWKHPEGSLKGFPNLKLISSFGAGVDHFLKDTQLPTGVPITRIVSKGLVDSMKKYVLSAVLSFHKNIFHHYRLKERKIWDRDIAFETELKIGILGLGQLGKASAIALNELGFEVSGFSRSPKEIPGIQCYNELNHKLSDFLQGLNSLICLLPLSPATSGILNTSVFNQLEPGSLLINAGRGGHMEEEDLIPALESGQIAEAWLDVFHQEPLPEDHPFWERPEIVITPHVASETPVQEAVEQFVENVKRILRGEELLHLVNPKRGY